MLILTQSMLFPDSIATDDCPCVRTAEGDNLVSRTIHELRNFGSVGHNAEQPQPVV